MTAIPLRRRSRWSRPRRTRSFVVVCQRRRKSFVIVLVCKRSLVWRPTSDSGERWCGFVITALPGPSCRVLKSVRTSLIERLRDFRREAFRRRLFGSHIVFWLRMFSRTTAVGSDGLRGIRMEVGYSAIVPMMIFKPRESIFVMTHFYSNCRI